MFAEAIKNELNKTTTLTENGAVAYVTSGKELVDMFFKVSSYRNLTEREIECDFAKAWAENPELALKFAFFVGDIREGLGERRMFRVILNWLASTTDISHLLELIPEYNRFDSLFLLKGTTLENQMVNFVKNKLTVDKVDAHPSLLAKWMPSINTSSAESRALARWFCSKFDMSEKEYRKTLSSIRAKLNVVETQMCANEWSAIKYEAVPSKANLLYKDAFLKHDEIRRTEFISKVNAGEAKINASVTMPHEIVHSYNACGWRTNSSLDASLEALWKNLKDTIKEGGRNIMVVRDGSGSMTSTIGGTSVSALEVATALSVYFSERQSGEFKDKFITFSSRPQLVDLSKCKTLLEKLKICNSYTECSNTDIEATFDLVLKTAVANHMKQEDIPDLLIVSDMEFDGATVNFGWNSSDANKATLFAQIEAKFNAAGYQLPKLIFWNVMSRTNGIPVQENVKGLALVSGFSTNVMDLVLSNKLDPFEILKEKLLKPRYDAITLAK